MDAETNVTARWKSGAREFEGPALNPGEYGKVYAIGVDEGYEVLWHVVEARTLEKACDEFFTNDATSHHVRIPGCDYGDYHVRRDDGEWTDLNGLRLGYGGRGAFPEVEYDQFGNPIDTDNVIFWPEQDLEGLRYFGIWEGRRLPAEGLTLEQFRHWTDVVEEVEHFLEEVKVSHGPSEADVVSWMKSYLETAHVASV